MKASKRIGVVFYEQSRNIGDDVQTLAMIELVRRINAEVEIVLVDREHLNDDSVRELDGLIVSGWFMDHPRNWPPNNDKILFVSFHVNSQNGASEVIQSENAAKDYLPFTPIGCRDNGTRRRFESIEVEAYFSGCATLTIEPTGERRRGGGILAIDPFYKVENKITYQNWQLKKLLTRKDFERCKLVSNDWLQLPTISHEMRLENAKSYLQEIQNSEYVITSRIHAALPAVALGTPVFFIDAGYDRSEKYRDRFDGLIELFNVIDASHFPLSSRKPWAKACRIVGAHRVFGRSNKSSVLHQAVENQQSLPIHGALVIKNQIERKVKAFVEAIVST